MLEYITDNPEINTIIYCIKINLIGIFTYLTSLKIIDKKWQSKIKNIIMIIPVSIICGIIKDNFNYLYNIMLLDLLLSIIFSKTSNNNIGYSIIITTFSLSINFILYFISTILSFFPIAIININDDVITFVCIIIFYLILILSVNKLKRLKNGINFLKKNIQNDYIDILILTISVIIIFCTIIISNYNDVITSSVGIALIIFSVIMFITIQKSLQLYYKQKLQQKELEETKEELEKAKKEITELEQENLNFSKKSHSIAHKQKALEYKLDQLLLNNEIAEEIDIKDKIKEISKQIQNEDTTIELTKTNIEEIDDMLKYMQSECKKNKINFELQVNGNIHHMVNKFVAKENLEILLADHIKNAIIAINYSENINRSILVKLGLIDGIYSIYIYDTGIEFEIKTLQNLGQVPSTTHADNGGTGMGFMNTFDTLNKYKASIIINEYGKPSEDSYTKYIAIKFDNKNEYKITSYRSEEIEKQLKKDNKITIFNNLKN